MKAEIIMAALAANRFLILAVILMLGVALVLFGVVAGMSWSATACMVR